MGQVAVVFGGASGIGAAIAERFTAAGWAVVVADLPDTDVTVEDSVAARLDAVVDEHGRLDLVVNSAGVSTLGNVVDLAVDEWRRVVDVCLNGAFIVMKHAGQRLSSGGSIVSLSSLNARLPGAGLAPYCAAKAGLSMLTQVAALARPQPARARGVRLVPRARPRRAQREAFPLVEPAEDPVPDVVGDRPLQALLPDQALPADGLGPARLLLRRGSLADREEVVRRLDGTACLEAPVLGRGGGCGDGVAGRRGHGGSLRGWRRSPGRCPGAPGSMHPATPRLRGMALLHDATLTPSKRELIAAWLPSQPWAAGLPELTPFGGFRFDDPDGEVGMEGILLRSGDGEVVVHVPLTYRGAPLAGAEDALLGTTEHSVLGTRWVYDAPADPVYREVLTATIVTAGTGAEEYFEVDGERVTREPKVSVAGSGGAPGASGDIAVVRVVGEPVESEAVLTGAWEGGAGVLAALV